MQFFYTGADAYNRPQVNSDKSLGGWVSNSLVPSGRVANLFSTESYKTYINGSFETKALVMMNEGADVTGLKFGYIYPSGYASYFKIEVAFVNLQSPNFQKMEQIMTSADTPYYGQFAEALIDPDLSIDDSLVIGNFISGAKLGVWVRRTLLAQTISSCDDTLPLPNLNDKTTSVQFKISWD
jgi:hypothetical protein